MDDKEQPSHLLDSDLSKEIKSNKISRNDHFEDVEPEQEVTSNISESHINALDTNEESETHAFSNFSINIKNKIERKINSGDISQHLIEHLVGSLDLYIEDLSEKISFNFKGGSKGKESQVAINIDTFNLKSANSLKDGIDDYDKILSSSDCVLVTTKPVLRAIIDGYLNSQIALISDKITILGKESYAERVVYFFNLLS